MNSAPADQKLDAVVAVVNKLVEERLAARQWKQAFKTHLLQALIDAGNGTNAVPTQNTNPPVQPNPPQSSQPVPPQNPAPIIPQQ